MTKDKSELVDPTETEIDWMEVLCGGTERTPIQQMTKEELKQHWSKKDIEMLHNAPMSDSELEEYWDWWMERYEIPQEQQ